MAEVLEVNQMLANAYEPKRQFRWIFQIDGIDAFTARSATRPSLTNESIVIDYINAKRFLAGKQTWNTITLTLNDPVSPSAAQKVMEWLRLHYEDLTGRSGYHSFYAKTISLQMLDPVGAVVEQWRGEGTWIVESNWGDLDYSSSEPVQVTLTLQADRWILEY